MKKREEIWLFVDGGARLKQKGVYDSGFHGAYAYQATLARGNTLIPFTSGGGFKSDTTTPRMEFTALLSGLQQTNLVLYEPELREHFFMNNDVEFDIYVVCDALNSVKTMTDWLHKWIAFTVKKLGSVLKKNDDGSEEPVLFKKPMKGGKMEPVMNQDLIIQLSQFLNAILKDGTHVKFLHVNSHIEASKMDAARIKFQDFNNMLVSADDFAQIVKYNEVVDGMVDDYYKKGIENIAKQN